MLRVCLGGRLCVWLLFLVVCLVICLWVVCYSLCVVCSVFVVCCFLSVACGLVFGVFLCRLFVVCCVLFVVCCFLVGIVCCLFCVVVLLPYLVACKSACCFFFVRRGVICLLFIVCGMFLVVHMLFSRSRVCMFVYACLLCVHFVSLSMALSFVLGSWVWCFFSGW